MTWQDRIKLILLGGGLFTFVVMVCLHDMPESSRSYFETHHALGWTKLMCMELLRRNTQTV